MINPEEYVVIQYTFIDDFRCFKPLNDALEKPYEAASNKQDVFLLRSTLEKMFGSAGWEGDGEINCIFLPPVSSKGEKTAIASQYFMSSRSIMEYRF